MSLAAMHNSSTALGVVQDHGSLPTLLSSNSNYVRRADTDAKIKGAHVEYYSKSYGEWVPAIINEVQSNGCLKLLHDDGSILKKEADPNSVRVAKENAKQSYDTQAKSNTSFSDRTFTMCSTTAGGIQHATGVKSSSKALGSREAFDVQMNRLHSLSEKCNAQLKIHRGLSDSMVQDQQLDLSHLEFRHSLSKAVGPDMASAMRSSDELMQQMNFRHGFSSMYDQQLKLDRSLSQRMPQQEM